MGLDVVFSRNGGPSDRCYYEAIATAADLGRASSMTSEIVATALSQRHDAPWRDRSNTQPQPRRTRDFLATAARIMHALVWLLSFRRPFGGSVRDTGSDVGTAAQLSVIWWVQPPECFFNSVVDHGNHQAGLPSA